MEIYVVINNNGWLEGVFVEEAEAQSKKTRLADEGKKCTVFQANLKLVKKDEFSGHPAQKILDLCRNLPGMKLEETGIADWAEEILMAER